MSKQPLLSSFFFSDTKRKNLESKKDSSPQKNEKKDKINIDREMPEISISLDDLKEDEDKHRKWTKAFENDEFENVNFGGNFGIENLSNVKMSKNRDLENAIKVCFCGIFDKNCDRKFSKFQNFAF